MLFSLYFYILLYSIKYWFYFVLVQQISMIPFSGLSRFSRHFGSDGPSPLNRTPLYFWRAWQRLPLCSSPSRQCQRFRKWSRFIFQHNIERGIYLYPKSLGKSHLKGYYKENNQWTTKGRSHFTVIHPYLHLQARPWPATTRIPEFTRIPQNRATTIFSGIRVGICTFE